MIELYNGDCRTFLSNYNGAQFDAVITDPPYASGGATLAERSASTSQKYTATKKACPFPDFMGDQMDARSLAAHDGGCFCVGARSVPRRCGAGGILRLAADAATHGCGAVGRLAVARHAGLGQTDQPSTEGTVPSAGGVCGLGEQWKIAD